MIELVSECFEMKSSTSVNGCWQSPSSPPSSSSLSPPPPPSLSSSSSSSSRRLVNFRCHFIIYSFYSLHKNVHLLLHQSREFTRVDRTDVKFRIPKCQRLNEVDDPEKSQIDIIFELQQPQHYRLSDDLIYFTSTWIYVLHPFHPFFLSRDIPHYHGIPHR